MRRDRRLSWACLRVWADWVSGSSEGATPLLIPLVVLRHNVELFHPRVEGPKVDESKRMVIREVRAGYPNTKLPSFFNDTSIKAPETLSMLGAGVLNISILRRRPSCRDLFPFSLPHCTTLCPFPLRMWRL